MKKLYALLLALAMCLSAVACGSNEVADTTNDSQTVSDVSDSEDVGAEETEDEADSSTAPDGSVETTEDAAGETVNEETIVSDGVEANGNEVESDKDIPSDSYDDTNKPAEKEESYTEELVTEEELQNESDYTQEEPLMSVAEIIANGGHPYDNGYHYNADDTGRRLSREEYDAWVALGYNPLVDNYYDSEHLAGLY